MANKNLTNAKKAKNDEFYTQFSDIQKEVESYLEYNPKTFKGKVVYSNCDDPFESNFFRYFVLNFNRLGLKRLISTSYKPSPVANSQLGLFGDDKTLPKSKGRPKITANKFIINEVGDIDGDGSFTLEDIAKQLRANKNNEWTPLEGDGDFRSDECVELLKQSDVVVTNPPFSLFREYITQLFQHKKQFLIIGNLNAITYKEVFPMIKENKVWLGNNARVNGGAMFYEIPEAVANLDQVREIKTDEKGKKVYITRVQGVRWFTNLDHAVRLLVECSILGVVQTKSGFKTLNLYYFKSVYFWKSIAHVKGRLKLKDSVAQYPDVHLRSIRKRRNRSINVDTLTNQINKSPNSLTSIGDVLKKKMHKWQLPEQVAIQEPSGHDVVETAYEGKIPLSEVVRPTENADNFPDIAGNLREVGSIQSDTTEPPLKNGEKWAEPVNETHIPDTQINHEPDKPTN